MAHHIYSEDSLILTRKPAWHGLGVIFPEAPDWESGTKNLGWTVSLVPLVAEYSDTEYIGVPQGYAVIRNDFKRSLGVVGTRYVPIQNLDAFSCVRPLVESGQCEIETCGSLHHGAKVFLLLSLKHSEVDVGDQNQDLIKPYLLVTTTHDGSASLKVGFTAVRVVCQNTLTSSLRGTGFTSIVHTASAKRSLEILSTTIDVGKRELASTAQVYRMLQEERVTMQRANEIIASYRTRNKDADESKDVSPQEVIIRNKMLDLFVREGGHNAWHLYNAINGYNVHDKIANKESRLSCLWFGNGVSEDREMLKFVCAEVGIAA